MNILNHQHNRIYSVIHCLYCPVPLTVICNMYKYIRVFIPIPFSLRYLKSVQKMNHLQKMFCVESYSYFSVIVFCTENEIEIILFFSLTCIAME